MKNHAPQAQPRRNQAPRASTGFQKKVYNVSTARTYLQDGEEKSFWTNIGTAFSGPKGISIEFNALPINGKVMLFEKTEQDQQN